MKDNIEEFANFWSEMQNGYYTVDEESVKQLMYVYETLKRVLTGDKLTIKTVLHKPSPKDGAVRVSGKNVNVLNTQKFAELIKIANNFDVRTNLKGMVEFDFSFGNLARRVRVENE